MGFAFGGSWAGGVLGLIGFDLRGCRHFFWLLFDFYCGVGMEGVELVQRRKWLKRLYENVLV